MIAVVRAACIDIFGALMKPLGYVAFSAFFVTFGFWTRDVYLFGIMLNWFYCTVHSF